MRIAFVLPGRGTSGGVRAVQRLATGLLSRGHTVRVLYRTPRPSLVGSLRDLYVYFRYRDQQDWLDLFPGEQIPFADLTPRIVGRNDVVIGVGIPSVLEIAHLPASCGIKINNNHGGEPWAPQREAQVEQLSMPRIVVASYLEHEMRRHGCRDPIFVVPNGVDTAEYYPCVPPEQRRGIGTIFNTTAPKNPAGVRDVLWQLYHRRPDVPLHVFGVARGGGFPPSASYLRLPSPAQARRLYSQSLVWFCASRWEGFGLPLLEAMACGCAVVSTECGGPSDFIEDGVNGFLVPVEDTQALTRRILQLFEDADLRGGMVQRSQATLQRFTWPNAVEAYEKALHSIVGTPAAAPAGR